MISQFLLKPVQNVISYYNIHKLFTEQKRSRIRMQNYNMYQLLLILSFNHVCSEKNVLREGVGLIKNQPKEVEKKIFQILMNYCIIINISFKYKIEKYVAFKNFGFLN